MTRSKNENVILMIQGIEGLEGLDIWAQKSYDLEQLVAERFINTDLSKLSEKQKKEHFETFLSDFTFILTGSRPEKSLQFLIEGMTNALQNPDGKGFLRDCTKIRLYFLYVCRVVSDHRSHSTLIPQKCNF